MAGSLIFSREHFFDGPFAKADRRYSEFEAHIDLYQRAAHSEHVQLISGKLISLGVGEQIASERFLENRWNWSRTKVRNFLSILKKNHELDHRKDQRETIINLVKYRDFTSLPSKKEPSKEPSSRPIENHQRTIKEPKEKEGKEGKEGKERDAKSRSSVSRFKKPSFEEWADYAETLSPPLPSDSQTRTYNYYEANGWHIGRSKMKDWKAALRNCHSRWESDAPKSHRATKADREFKEEKTEIPRL